jgi:hypothetical protein
LQVGREYNVGLRNCLGGSVGVQRECASGKGACVLDVAPGGRTR